MATSSAVVAAATPHEKVHAQVHDASRSLIRRYQRLVVGSASALYTLRYELLTTLVAPLPGALGLALRRLLYPALLGQVGRGALIGAGVTLRHARKIYLGARAVVSDGCVLDARGDANRGIDIGQDATIGQRALLLCKGGDMQVGARTGIGAYCGLYAVGGNRLDIGDDVLIGPFAYLGGTQYSIDRTDVPIAAQGHDLRGGIRIGAGAWIGAHAAVLDGVTIGRGAVVAAGAVVVRDVPDNTVVGGVPARVLRTRGAAAPEPSA